MDRSLSGRPVLNRQGKRTREAILNAAEELFGQGSFDSVSTRDIAEGADVLLGVVGYHFKSKEALFRAVAARRADEVNRVRLDRLNALEDPTVEEIIDAFVRPALELHSQPDWRHYMNIVTQIAHEKRWRALDSDLFLENALVFLSALKRALPESDPERIRVGLLHGISVLISVLGGGTARLNHLGRGEQGPDVRVSGVDDIVSFVASGILAVAHAK
ncbi:TetR/AcrR family transcriptional regulator [Streptomyces sp. NPDC101455]|uniref:TetR/AcrR family transcriptional regulator n=1 Tax=Streptomyces sp. NPDC101455 TaxID=3366142 RepID=UPI0037F89F86